MDFILIVVSNTEARRGGRISEGKRRGRIVGGRWWEGKGGRERERGGEDREMRGKNR